MNKYFILLLMLVLSFGVQARVTRCAGDGYTLKINLGDITVDPALKVGDVIATQDVWGTDQAIQTTFGSWYIYFKYSNKTPGAYHAIDTNLKGIGVRMSMRDIANSYFPYSAKGTCSGLISCSGAMPSNMTHEKLELIKTADSTDSGALSGGVFAYAQCDNGQIYTNFAFGTSNITGSTCDLDTAALNVDLGDYKTTDFTGVGTTTEKKTVAIPVTCTGANSAFSLAVSAVNPADITNGVMALDSGGASGIGVQLLQSDGITPVPLTNSSWSAGTSVIGTNTINLFARYYQLDNTVTSGNATSSVTLTFNYK